jgi:hypothetical protein
MEHPLPENSGLMMHHHNLGPNTQDGVMFVLETWPSHGDGCRNGGIGNS